MDRKTYMKEVYSKYWIDAREKKYGFMPYDKTLCDFICKHINGGRLLEVAVGTGYPFADFFSKKGFSMYGIDISPELIAKGKGKYPNIDLKVGDAEALEYADNYFDCVYCFHSTWYFPDLKKSIDEMVRVTRPGGMVVFDIQNRNNKAISKAYEKRKKGSKLSARYTRYAKNIVKIILRKGTPDWCFVVSEVPTYPENLYEHLSLSPQCAFKVYLVNEHSKINSLEERLSFEQYGRLVFGVFKANNVGVK